MSSTEGAARRLGRGADGSRLLEPYIAVVAVAAVGTEGKRVWSWSELRQLEIHSQDGRPIVCPRHNALRSNVLAWIWGTNHDYVLAGRNVIRQHHCQPVRPRELRRAARAHVLGKVLRRVDHDALHLGFGVAPAARSKEGRQQHPENHGAFPDFPIQASAPLHP